MASSASHPPQGSSAPYKHVNSSSTGSAAMLQSTTRLNGSHSRDSRESSLRERSSLVSALPAYDGPVLKSQYPSDSMENHVEYILVASFDVDRGSVMEHQYPGPISGDEHMLAELMLPDQAHVRSMDWTIFFLHKDTTVEEDAREERKRQRKIKLRIRMLEDAGQPIPDAEELAKDLENVELGADDQSDFSSREDDDAEGPPLIYVLNLVNTKQDQTKKRGAVVRAMAICTRHSFLHIYKPLLLLALEEYFRMPTIDTLALLYNAVNSMDLSLMPRLTHLERHILQSSDVKDMFVEKFSIMIQQRMTEDEHRLSQNSEPSSIGSPVRKSRYQVPRDTHEFESRVLYNGVPVPIKVPLAITPETVGDFSLVKLISTFATPHATSPQPFAVHPHLTTSGPYTHPIIVLINALLTQKRIVFLGHNQPSGSVAEAVLAACALASGGILKGFTRHAFPYTDLTKIDDLLKVPGFIAGVTNPAFAHKPEWWDLLCDLPTGRMKISHKIEGAPITEGLLYFQNGGPGSLIAKEHLTANGDNKSNFNDSTGDTVFMESVMGSISQRHGEPAVRNKFRAWVQRFTLIAAAFEEVVYGASALNIGAAETDEDAYGYGVGGHGLVWPDEPSRMREIQANVGRVEGWRQTRSYYSLIRDLARNWEKGEFVRGIDLGYQIDRLRTLRLGDGGAADIYMAIARAVDRAGVELNDPDFENPLDLDDPENEDLEIDEEMDYRLMKREKARSDVINQLLCVMPETNGGLFYLSLGLFHKDVVVREAIVGLLQRIMIHDAGRHFWATLGRFAKLAFFRVKRESEKSQAQELM